MPCMCGRGWVPSPTKIEMSVTRAAVPSPRATDFRLLPHPLETNDLLPPER
jgi:hypothetical protein